MNRTRLKPGLQASNWKYLWMAAMAAILSIGQAAAQDCHARWPQIQYARDDLQRAFTEGDLASAQDYADRARRRFDNLAVQAARCECPPAAARFEEAAAGLRRAQEAESRKELREVAAGAKAMFEAAQAQLEGCRKR